MKKIFLSALAIFMTLSAFVAQAAQPQIIVTGHDNNGAISIIDMNSNTIVWQYPLEAREFSNSVALLEGGKYIAYSTQLGAKVVSIADKKVVFEHKVPAVKTHELHSVCALKGGGVALFQAGTPCSLIILNKKFKKVGGFTFGGGNKHGQFRQATQSAKGTWLIPNFLDASIVEYNDKGDVLNTYPIGTKSFGIKEGKDGMFYLGLGDGHKYAKYDPKKKEFVKEFTTLKGLQFNFVYNAQYQEIGKGKYMVANWTGHRKQKKTFIEPQVIMFDENDEVLWYWKEDQGVDLTKVSAFYYSETPLVK
ncbi:MAG: hypothetical protein R3Y38_00135 [Rikenellaceae bacterium]